VQGAVDACYTGLCRLSTGDQAIVLSVQSMSSSEVGLEFRSVTPGCKFRTGRASRALSVASRTAYSIGPDAIADS